MNHRSLAIALLVLAAFWCGDEGWLRTPARRAYAQPPSAFQSDSSAGRRTGLGAPYGGHTAPPSTPGVTARPSAWPGHVNQLDGGAQGVLLAQNAPGGQPVFGPPPVPRYPQAGPPSPGAAPDVQRSAAYGPSAGFEAASNQPSYAPAPSARELEGAKIVAWVDSDVILYSEVAGLVNEILAQNADQIPPEHIEAQRDLLVQRLLVDLIDTKLIAAEARRNIPEENLPNLTSRLEDDFENNEIDKLVRRNGVANRDELDAKLRSLGSSLDREKRAHAERTLARMWLSQQVRSEKEASYDELINYYNEHIAEYEYPGRARWEQILIRPERYREQETLREIQLLGNQLLAGAPFASIAQAHSEGPTASRGGQYDWTTLSNLVEHEFHLSDVLVQALEGLPVGSLSRVIQDDQGYHIVRVIERVPAGRKSFVDVQDELREKIKQEHGRSQVREYVDGLKEKAIIRTVYDPPGGNRLSDRRFDAAPHTAP